MHMPRAFAVTASLALLAAGASPAAGAPVTGVPGVVRVPGVVGVSNCLHVPRAPHPATLTSRAPRRLRVHLVTTGLEVPWGIVFLPDGDALVSTRDPRNIIEVRPGGRKRFVKHVRAAHTNVSQGGEGGLLGLALSPHFRTDHWVYAYYSTYRDNRIARMRWHNGHLGGTHVILSGIPHGVHHNGGRIAFGPGGMLFATTGESGNPSLAQDKRSLGGKILRMTPTGRPAPGNPFPHSVVWTYGHRNVEGLAWDRTHRLWATEFGNHRFDELNWIRRGRDYGWPLVEGRSRRFTNPVITWPTESAGPSGISIWPKPGGGIAWIGGVTGQRLFRVVLRNGRVIGRHAYLQGQIGRIRSTAISPHGWLWFTTSNRDGRATPRRGDDKIFRIKLQ
ncbi:MAG: PQQ-dependent sugar dehydrogenase [Nocardioidaceae bacterium]